MLVARQARRGAVRGEPMPDRAGIDGGARSSTVHSGMAGRQLFRILGQDTSGRLRTSSGYSQSFAVREYFPAVLLNSISRLKYLAYVKSKEEHA